MMARLSVSPPFSPLFAQALKAASRRSRRADPCRNASTEERESETPYLPLAPRSAARAAAEARKLSERPVERVFVQQQQEGGFIGQHILRKRGAKPREPFDDGRHARALIAFEPRAGAR